MFSAEEFLLAVMEAASSGSVRSAVYRIASKPHFDRVRRESELSNALDWVIANNAGTLKGNAEARTAINNAKQGRKAVEKMLEIRSK